MSAIVGAYGNLLFVYLVFKNGFGALYLIRHINLGKLIKGGCTLDTIEHLFGCSISTLVQDLPTVPTLIFYFEPEPC